MNRLAQFPWKIAVTAALVAPLAGCACCDAGCFGGHGGIVGWSAPSMCYGYHPTCWRPWPAECPPCPPPYGTEPIAPWVQPPMPAELPAAPPEAAPPEDAPQPPDPLELQPMPPAELPLPSQPRVPSPSDRGSFEAEEAPQQVEASLPQEPFAPAATARTMYSVAYPVAQDLTQETPEAPVQPAAHQPPLAPIVSPRQPDERVPEETSSRRYWIEGRR